MQTAKRHGCLASVFWLFAICAGVFYGVAALTAPWAFHIGGRWTPLLYWSASGELHTRNGTYPLYVLFHPSASFSRLKLDGLRPTGGVEGTASLCTAPGVRQYMKLGGTVFGGYRSTEGSEIHFRLAELRIINVGQRQGYFDLYGRWKGAELVMDDRGRPGNMFRSGLKIDKASVTLDPEGFWDFKATCAAMTKAPAGAPAKP
jgi:hypothetical protein